MLVGTMIFLGMLSLAGWGATFYFYQRFATKNPQTDRADGSFMPLFGAFLAAMLFTTAGFLAAAEEAQLDGAASARDMALTFVSVLVILLQLGVFLFMIGVLVYFVFLLRSMYLRRQQEHIRRGGT